MSSPELQVMLTAQARRNIDVLQQRMTKVSERNKIGKERLDRQLAHAVSQLLCPHVHGYAQPSRYRCTTCKLTVPTHENS